MSNVDLELEEFENKINNITEQFMSLLDSNDIIEASVTDKFNTISKPCDENYIETYKEGPAIFNGQPITNFGNSTAYKLGTDGINIGGIAYGKDECISMKDLPGHAVKFDSVEQMELNKELEKLYDLKHGQSKAVLNEKPNIAFSDSNIGRINRLGLDYNECSQIQTNSTLNNKEVYDMSNNGEELKNENTIFSYATIPAEQALVEKKNWKDILFMDIPWDTKIDIWGGIKKFCSIQVKFVVE